MLRPGHWFLSCLSSTGPCHEHTCGNLCCGSVLDLCSGAGGEVCIPSRAIVLTCHITIPTHDGGYTLAMFQDLPTSLVLHIGRHVLASSFLGVAHRAFNRVKRSTCLLPRSKVCHILLALHLSSTSARRVAQSCARAGTVQFKPAHSRHSCCLVAPQKKLCRKGKDSKNRLASSLITWANGAQEIAQI